MPLFHLSFPSPFPLLLLSLPLELKVLGIRVQVIVFASMASFVNCYQCSKGSSQGLCPNGYCSCSDLTGVTDLLLV